MVSTSAPARAVGTGHSFSRVADTTGTLVSTGELDLPLEVHGDERLVVVPGGVTYARLTAALHDQGWALHNLGSLPHISVAGACSTGTHGSGNANGSLSTAVASVELVRADGELVRFSDGDPAVPGGGARPRLPGGRHPALAADRAVVRGEPGGAHRGAVGGAARAARRGAGDGVQRQCVLDVLRPVPRGRRVAEAPGRRRATARRPPLLGVPPDTVPRHPVQGMDPAATTAQLGERGPWHHRLPHFRPEFTPSAGEELQSEYFLAREHAAEAFEALFALADRDRAGAAGVRDAYRRG